MMTNRLKRIGSLAVSAALAVSLFSGCASTASEPTGPAPTVPAEIMEEAYVDALSLELVELEDEYSNPIFHKSQYQSFLSR